MHVSSRVGDVGPEVARRNSLSYTSSKLDGTEAPWETLGETRLAELRASCPSAILADDGTVPGMFDNTVATLTQSNAKLVDEISKLNDRVAETLQVERRNGALDARVKELEGVVGEMRRELHEAQSDKFALEQELKLGTAQRIVQRKQFVVKFATVGMGTVVIVCSFTLFVLSVCAVLPVRGMIYSLCLGAAPGLSLLVLSARPTESRSVRCICAFLLNDMGNPFFPSPKHLFLAATVIYALPSTCPADTPLQCATYSISCASIFFLVTPMALYVMPKALVRHPGSGPWYHSFGLGWDKEYTEWSIRVWGACATFFVSRAAPFVIWAAVQEEQGAFAVPPRLALLLVWRTLRVCLLVVALNFGAAPWLAHALLAALGRPAPLEPTLIIDCAVGCLSLVLLVLLLSSANRGRFYAFISKAAVSGQAGRAAGIAALVGKTDAAKTLALARRNFRGIRFTDLSAEHFRSNADTGLHAKATRYRLGEIDAFLSHSWHDDPAAKWRVLERWAKEFDARHRRSPSLWLDKASIRQEQDIAAQLACLPVWLSGCREMVVAAGPTFAERLWCVLEVFTFLRLGGSYDHLILLPLEADSSGGAGGGEGEEAPSADAVPPGGELLGTEEAKVQVLERFRTFDCKRASCFREDERQHLLSVIENGFGDVEVFNSVVRHLFTNRLEGGGDEGKSTRRQSTTRRDTSHQGNASTGLFTTAAKASAIVVPRLGGDRGLEA